VLARALVAALLLLAAFSAGAGDFVEGQVWSYRTRPNEGASTLLIGKIEKDPTLGVIYHISISGLSIRDSRAESGVRHELPHIPVSQQTLQSSCLQLLGNAAPNPNFAQGYAEWKKAFDQGQAGVYSISVAEIVDIADKMLRR
jgi:hypothetical protein